MEGNPTTAAAIHRCLQLGRTLNSAPNNMIPIPHVGRHVVIVLHRIPIYSSMKQLTVTNTPINRKK